MYTNSLDNPHLVNANFTNTFLKGSHFSTQNVVNPNYPNFSQNKKER
jgi:hypothetical protein